MVTTENRFWQHSPMNRPGPKTWLTDERRQAAVACRRFGMVPLAIADYLGLSDATTSRYLREAEERGEIDPLPAWPTLHGPPRDSKEDGRLIPQTPAVFGRAARGNLPHRTSTRPA
jgi:hypothetical protein